MNIKLFTENLDGFISEKDYKNVIPEVERAHEHLINKSGKGKDFTGWVDLPSRLKDDFLSEITALGKEVRENSDCIVSVGIGGSYVGIRASLEFLIADQKIPVYYAGNNLSAGYLYYLLKNLEGKRVTVIVISKSGTTTEPALAFRIIKQYMEKRYSAEELKKRIICITDSSKGALRKIADLEGYRSYPIDDDVGGRFSILTPVGLIPLAIAGINIKDLINGARRAEKHCSIMDINKNLSYKYAASRYLLYKSGKVIEILATFYQRFSFIEEWWKQLFGESEGKNGKGIFPSSVSFTSDLHSMGQLLQEGERNMFETFLIAEESEFKMTIPSMEGDIDGFNCIAGKDLDWVNSQAYKGTAAAHFEGGVPNMTITLPSFTSDNLGQLFYFFEKTVAITGYLLDVNPFNQPGVEAYKKKMFALLGKG